MDGEPTSNSYLANKTNPKRELLGCLLGISPSGRNPCGGNKPTTYRAGAAVEPTITNFTDKG